MLAVVTGGCSGLGKYFTTYLLTKGYQVYALYNTSEENAIKLEKQYMNLTCIKCDIRDENSIKVVLSSIPKIDLLINNAAISIDNSFINKTKEEFMQVLETNLVGTFLVIKYASLNMDFGTIINISSNNALDNYNPISMDYDASKAGVNILTKDFSSVLNSKVISICPGWINTSSVKKMNPDYLKREMEKVNQTKLIEPDELAKYIIDNYDEYDTGEIIEIKVL